MGTRSKGRIRKGTPTLVNAEGIHESDSVKFRYKQNPRQSKLARRISRRHNRGRDFTKVLGYQFATKNLEKMAGEKELKGSGLRERIKEIVG